MRVRVTLAGALLGFLLTAAIAASDCKPADFKDVNYDSMDDYTQLMYLDTLSDKELDEFKHKGTAKIPYMGMGFTGDFDKNRLRELKRTVSQNATSESRRTILRNYWTSTGLAAFQACLNEPLTLSASPSAIYQSEFFIKINWKPPVGGLRGMVKIETAGGQVVNDVPLEIPAHSQAIIKVRRDKSQEFQLAINVSGVVETFELPAAPKKLEVKRRTFERQTVEQTTTRAEATRLFERTPSAGFKFVPETLVISATLEPWTSIATEPDPKAPFTVLVKNEDVLRIQMSAYRSVNIATKGYFDVSIVETRVID